VAANGVVRCRVDVGVVGVLVGAGCVVDSAGAGVGAIGAYCAAVARHRFHYHHRVAVVPVTFDGVFDVIILKSNVTQ